MFIVVVNAFAIQHCAYTHAHAKRTSSSSSSSSLSSHTHIHIHTREQDHPSSGGAADKTQIYVESGPRISSVCARRARARNNAPRGLRRRVQVARGDKHPPRRHRVYVHTHKHRVWFSSRYFNDQYCTLAVCRLCLVHAGVGLNRYNNTCIIIDSLAHRGAPHPLSRNFSRTIRGPNTRTFIWCTLLSTTLCTF